MTRRIAILLAATMFVGLLSVIGGCGSLYKSKPEQLKASVRTFNENVRWKRYHAASDFIPEERREAWIGLQNPTSSGLLLQVSKRGETFSGGL